MCIIKWFKYSVKLLIMNNNRDIIDDISIEQLINLQKQPGRMIVLKFTATWCRPCQTIKQLCNDCFTHLPENVFIIELDIDNNLDLYSLMKKHRIVSGIPAILAWYPDASREPSRWYIPNDSVSGSSKTEVFDFFKRCNEKASRFLNNCRI